MPSSLLRQTVLSSARRVVVKLGTQLLSRADGRLDMRYLRRIAAQVAELTQKGVEVTLVSSGAIGAGCAELRLSKRPSDVAALQAVAAVGQRCLMAILHDAFSHHDMEVGQVQSRSSHCRGRDVKGGMAGGVNEPEWNGRCEWKRRCERKV